MCHGAYVTFDHEESYVRCLNAYKHSTSWWRRLFQSKHLRFQYKKALSVSAAPDPSDVIWENLDTSQLSRWCRTQLTFAISFFLIVMSFALILVGLQLLMLSERMLLNCLCFAFTVCVFFLLPSDGDPRARAFCGAGAYLLPPPLCSQIALELFAYTPCCLCL